MHTCIHSFFKRAAPFFQHMLEQHVGTFNKAAPG
jgi:hypothetical protein